MKVSDFFPILCLLLLQTACQNSTVESPLFHCLKIENAKERQSCREQMEQNVRLEEAEKNRKEEQKEPENKNLKEFTVAMANALALKGDKDGAIRAYQNITDKQPRNAPAFFKLALLQIDKNMFAPSLDNLNKAIELRPNWASAHYYRALVLGVLGRKEAMLQDLQIAVQFEPNNFEAHFQLGMAKRNFGGNPQEALAILRRAVAIWEEQYKKNPLAVASQYESYQEAKKIVVENQAPKSDPNNKNTSP